MRLNTWWICIALVGCGQGASPPPLTGSNITVAGIVTERFDAAPYSYIRISTDQGPLWAAAPMAEVVPGSRARVTHGAVVKNFSPPGTGRKFDVVVFGVLER